MGSELLDGQTADLRSVLYQREPTAGNPAGGFIPDAGSPDLNASMKELMIGRQPS